MGTQNLQDVETNLNWWLRPKFNAEDWDNVGLLVGSGRCSKKDKMIDKILLCNDLTLKVVDEAIEMATNLIIAYHPPIFKALKTITNDKWKEAIMLKCIANDICIYSPHTALDSIPGGINDAFVKILDRIGGLLDVQPINPRFPKSAGFLGAGFSFSAEPREMSLICSQLAEAPNPDFCYKIDMHGGKDNVTVSAYCVNASIGGKLEDFQTMAIDTHGRGNYPPFTYLDKPAIPGSGRTVILKSSVPLKVVASGIKSELRLDYLQVADAGRDQISTVAICAGSGGSMLVGLKVDLVITGEMSHHEILDCVQVGTAVILLGHCNSERHYLPTLEATLKVILGGRGFDVPEITISKTDLAPLKLA